MTAVQEVSPLTEILQPSLEVPTVELSPEREAYLMQLPAAQLVHEIRPGERLKRDEWIPLSKIVVEEGIIDDDHADELGMAMIGPWGQTMPILTRCRMGGATVNDTLNDVLDGFHRTEGLRRHTKQPDPLVKTVVLYGCSDEEMIDQRILAANSVKSVKFARLGMWMDYAWRLTPWKDKLTVAQAGGIAQNDSSGKLLGISQEEAEQIKIWIRRKSDTWLISIGTLVETLRVIENSAPALVSQVRTGAFTKGELSLTPAQLGIISEAFPKHDSIQIQIALIAHRHSLNSVRLANFVAELKTYGRLDQNLIQDVFTSGDWRSSLINTPSPTSSDGARAKEPLEGYTKMQVLATIRTLRRQALYSPQIEALGMREQVVQGLDEIADMIREGKPRRRAPNTDDSDQGPEKATKNNGDIQSERHLQPVPSVPAHLFIQQWGSPAILGKLSKDMEAQGNLREQWRLIVEDIQVRVAKQTVDRLFAASPPERPAFVLLRHLPLETLPPKQIDTILDYLDRTIGRLKGHTYNREDVSSCLRLVMATLTNMHEVAMLAPDRWKMIVRRVQDISSRGDSECKEQVTWWTKTQLEELNKLKSPQETTVYRRYGS